MIVKTSSPPAGPVRAAAFAAVDVNKASQAELEAVKGIGPSMSAASSTSARGPFKDWTDLMQSRQGRRCRQRREAVGRRPHRQRRRVQVVRQQRSHGAGAEGEQAGKGGPCEDRQHRRRTTRSSERAASAQPKKRRSPRRGALGVGLAERHQLARVRRFEQQVARQRRAARVVALARHADAAQHRADRHRQAAEVLRRRCRRAAGSARSPARRSAAGCVARARFGRQQRQRAVDALQALDVDRQRIEEDVRQRMAGDLREVRILAAADALARAARACARRRRRGCAARPGAPPARSAPPAASSRRRSTRCGPRSPAATAGNTNGIADDASRCGTPMRSRTAMRCERVHGTMSATAS